MAALKTALLFQDDNFVGREYFRALGAADIPLAFVAAVGRMAPESIAIERERTGGLWNPPPIPPERVDAKFSGLADPALWAALRERKIDVAIQGGLGILKPDMLSVPRLGFVNVHPGRLPAYRGRNCPEWAILEGDDVYATAHLIDAGIDTGPVICEGRYALSPGWTYADFRAGLYVHCASVLIDALRRLNGATPATLANYVAVQDETKARYREGMAAADIERTKAALARRTGATRHGD